MTANLPRSHKLHSKLLMAADSSSSSSSSNALVLSIFLALSLLIPAASSDISSDVAECGSHLLAMQTCITFVQGTAEAPTPDCCAGLKTVLANRPKCLCILVKMHDDPQLPIKINVTRALALPTACSARANISKCPQILKLPPNSKEAEIFKQSGSPTQAKGSSTINTTTGTSPRASSETSSGRSDYLEWRGWLARKAVVACVLFLVMPLPLST
ncbi:unnamed protein product [Musa banksii]